ncbi:MAG: glycogen synthase GlgA [Candidatus Omnitrophica bacterium]|nr:glycogen synthase GlgA [Candidatus Omnitrophota bacterium]
MKRKKLEIVFVSPEVAPFAKTGGLADVAESLPKALAALDCQIKVFLPLYRQVKLQKLPLKLIKDNIKIKIKKTNLYFSLYTFRDKGVNFFFIRNDRFFNRKYLYSTVKKDYPDNALRFAFFSQAVLAGLMHIRSRPDVIHCNEWQSALIPFYLKFLKHYLDYFKNTKTVFTIHNLIYQGLFSKKVMSEIGINKKFFNWKGLEFYGKLSLIKAGLIYSDALTTVSRGYAREILTWKFGCGLEGLLNMRKDRLYGIVNGVDYNQWNPKKDKFLKFNYDNKDLGSKLNCKKDLLKSLGLEVDPARPLLGNVSRLVPNKGIDIILESLDDIIKLNCCLVLLGLGNDDVNRRLKVLAKDYPKRIAVKVGFDNSLAHKIEAGCDIYLMPSRYEPCGLNQLYSLKYGTIPIVGAVGGLDDTIIDYRYDKKKGNGFKLKPVNKREFLRALRYAVEMFADKKSWNKIVSRVMTSDFSWKKSAKEYIKLYRGILSSR